MKIEYEMANEQFRIDKERLERRCDEAMTCIEQLESVIYALT